MAKCLTPLHRSVAINEDIKTIVVIAFRINVMAINAILIARRAGASCRGFGVVSGELRNLSQQLREAMFDLRQMTYELVGIATTMAKSQRSINALEAALKQVQGTSSAAAIMAGLTRQRQQAAGHAHMQKQIRSQLLQRLDDAAQLGEMGTVLASVAKIEAAYGGGFSESLTHVSQEFSVTIGEILSCLATLRRQLQ